MKNKKEYNKDYYLKNKDYLSKRSKIYNEENKVILSKKKQQYYQENKEKIKEKKKQYYEENKEKIKNYNKNKRKGRCELKSTNLLDEFNEKNKNRKLFIKNIKNNMKNDGMQTCTQCKENKALPNFGMKYLKNTGVYSKVCKQCLSEYNKKYREENKEKIKITKKNYKEKNRELFKQRRLIYFRKKFNTDPLFKLKSNIRCLIGNSFRNNDLKKKHKTEKILGCSFEYFKKHLESKFEPWMTWENKALYDGTPNFGWDIDHIIPLTIASSEAEIIKLNHYKNLQPLCSYINRDIKNKFSY